jgi:hypothetical protein
MTIGDDRDLDERATQIANEVADKVIKIVATPPFRRWDGNGGHKRDWRLIFVTAAGALAVIFVTGLWNMFVAQYWSPIKSVEAKVDGMSKKLDTVADYMEISAQLNDTQSDAINRETAALWQHIWPKVPCPPKVPTVKEMKDRK